MSLGLAGELDRDLAVKNGFAVELGDGALGLGGGGEVDKGVADGAGGARVDGDRGGLAVVVGLAGRRSKVQALAGC